MHIRVRHGQSFHNKDHKAGHRRGCAHGKGSHYVPLYEHMHSNYMCKADNNLDGAKHKLADPKIPRAKRMKKTGKTKKQITLKKSIVVKQWSGTQTVTVEKPSAAGIKKAKKEQRVFFGLDLHKKFLQGVVVAADQKGDLLMSKRVENDLDNRARVLSVPKKCPTCIEIIICVVWHILKTCRRSGS